MTRRGIKANRDVRPGPVSVCLCHGPRKGAGGGGKACACDQEDLAFERTDVNDAARDSSLTALIRVGPWPCESSAMLLSPVLRAGLGQQANRLGGAAIVTQWGQTGAGDVDQIAIDPGSEAVGAAGADQVV